jgi:hypothetical protein
MWNEKIGHIVYMPGPAGGTSMTYRVRHSCVQLSNTAASYKECGTLLYVLLTGLCKVL